MRAVDELRRLDPTEPHFILLYAQALYETGEHARAKKILKQWLKANRSSPVLPVILYHGMTPLERDPMVSYPYHYRVRVFADHMRALHDAGYNPVTAEDVNAWLGGHKTLPPRPVLIAFDDNRRDSFLYADPVLEKYHLKATMFVAITNIDYHHPPAFVSWDELNHYQSTGRWELQSHGDIAHIYVNINKEGGRGLFLMNRKWLDDQNRLETLDEWKARIAEDHQNAKDKMTRGVGHTPTAYAWPEGLFGQQGSTNASETSPINQALIKKYFTVAYTQDQFGLNVRTKDRGHMTRIIPNNTWTGEDLLRHFHDRNPFTLFELQLFRMGHLRRPHA